MDEKYRIHYEIMFKSAEELFSKAVSKGNQLRALLLLQAHIRDAELSLPTGITLRSDAKYFLLVNFFHMVFRPVDMNLPLELEVYQLVEMIRDDINFLIETASKETQNNEITSHTILKVVNDEWAKLKTNSIKVWG